MTLAEAMAYGLTGGHPPARLVSGGVPSLGDLEAFQAIQGSQRASARAVGVSLSTWQRWLAGTTPRAINQGKFWESIRRWRRRNALDRDREQEIRGRRIKMRIKAYATFRTSRKGSDGRIRTMELGSKFPEGLMSKIVDAWLGMEDDRVAALIQSGIDGPYEAPGLRLHADRVAWVRFE